MEATSSISHVVSIDIHLFAMAINSLLTCSYVYFDLYLLLYLKHIAHEWMRNNFGINEKGQERLFLLKSVILWDITPCSPLNVNRLGGTYRRHFFGPTDADQPSHFQLNDY
jgi:hypothetical protein